MSKVLFLNKISDTTLYKELLSRESEMNKSLIANLIDLCQEASDRVKLLPKYFHEYTLHDESHFLRVTEIMAMILGEQLKELNDLEIWFLIMAAFYHDQGMVIESHEIMQLESEDEYLLFRKNWQMDHPNYLETKKQLESNCISEVEKDRLNKLVYELDVAILTDFLRINHGQRSCDYVNGYFLNDARLDIYGVNLSHYLALICLSHVKSPEWLVDSKELNFDENIGTLKVNTIFISIILRLADILDFDSDRTPDVLFKSIHFTSQLSIKEWKKHRSVQGWEISKQIIRFTMLFDHPVYEKTARTFMDWIDDELSRSHRILRSSPLALNHYKLNIPEKTNRERLAARNKAYLYKDVEFTLSRNEIVKLLLTDNLYKNSSLFIRELLQNGLDALRLRKALFAKEGIEWSAGKIQFRNYIDKNGDNVVECEDNGVGMDEDIISKFLGKVGRSYYRSPEFEQLRIVFKEKGVDFEPCSQFGIGFMSCFMIGDRIDITTRKDNGPGSASGTPLKIEINGLGGLMVLRKGKNDQPVGTIVKVYSREREPFYDDWSDSIRLIRTLKGVALANEFPIEASCEIESITNAFTIEPCIDKKATFLEKRGIISIKTIEVDLTTIHPDLHGFLRQSFLVDEKGLPGLSSSEAFFEVRQDENWKDRSLFKLTFKNRTSGEEKGFDIDYRDNHSVCIDGILVCGLPGRTGYGKHEMMSLGHLSSKVHSEHPFTIDVRGNIKPELNPAREPLGHNGIIQLPPGWRQLQRLIDQASGKLWETLLLMSTAGLNIETFWQLLIAYDGSASNISCSTILDFLKLPTSNHGWINISDLDTVFFDQDGVKIFATDKKGERHEIKFGESVSDFSKTHRNGLDFTLWIKQVILGISVIDFKAGIPTIKIRHEFNTNERPVSNILKAEFSRVRCLAFTNLPSDFIYCADLESIVNLRNPVIELSSTCHLGNLSDPLESFAVTLSNVVPQMMKSRKDNNHPYTLNLSGRSLKYLGYKYLLIDWAKYDVKFRPPYKIYVNNTTTLEITDEILRKWSISKLVDE